MSQFVMSTLSLQAHVPEKVRANVWSGELCYRLEVASACSIFEMFSTALEWVAMNKLGLTNVVHVIEDFVYGRFPGDMRTLYDGIY